MDIKKAIYKYMKILNKIQAKKFGWSKSTLKMQNDLEYEFVNNLTTNNINNILEMATSKTILNFM